MHRCVSTQNMEDRCESIAENEGVKIKTEEHEGVKIKTETDDKEKIKLQVLEARLEIIGENNAFWPETIDVAKGIVRRLPAELQMHVRSCAVIAAKYMQDGAWEGDERKIFSSNNDEQKIERRILDALEWKVHSLIDTAIE